MPKTATFLSAWRCVSAIDAPLLRQISRRTSRPQSSEPKGLGVPGLEIHHLGRGLPRRRFFPVRLEHVAKLPGHRGVGDDDAHLAALVQFDSPKALTADKGTGTIPHDGAR